MAQYLTQALTQLKATWDPAGHKKVTSAEISALDKTRIRAFLMVDTDSFSTFLLRAPVAVLFGINSIEAPTTATLWQPSKDTTTSTTASVNELFGANVDYAGTPVRMGQPAGKLCKLKLRNPILKSRTNLTGEQAGTFPNETADGKSRNIRWLNQHFPRIASMDYICAFFGENATTPPLQIIIGNTRKFLDATTNPKPSELKPLTKQIEGNKGSTAELMWNSFGP